VSDVSGARKPLADSGPAAADAMAAGDDAAVERWMRICRSGFAEVDWQRWAEVECRMHGGIVGG
jgi:hypothetical protein